MCRCVAIANEPQGLIFLRSGATQPGKRPVKPIFGAALLLFASAPTALAETCHEKFVRLLVHGNGADTPVKIHVTQEMKGGKPTTNYNHQIGPDHWMTEMIEPANASWTLVHDNTMYSSTDKGKSWQKVRTLDAAHSPEAVAKALQEDAKTARNAACGEDEVDGVAFDTVEADYTAFQGQYTYHNRYWVDRETGWIARATYKTVGPNFEMFTTQVIEKAPGLTLPTPE